MIQPLPLTTRSFLAVCLTLLLACHLSAQSTGSGFADPDRLPKLLSAVPAIDQLVRDFAERNHVPGIGYGIVIDGKLVHVATAGYREVASITIILITLLTLGLAIVARSFGLKVGIRAE